MSKKLLLADDSVTIQKVIEITFANQDYDLTIVGNGDEALEKAKLNAPDLIIADIIMPGKNGYELCSAIKSVPELAQTPVLLLAGSFEPFDEEKARSVGADSWIAKPFESHALIEKVKTLLDNPPQPVQTPSAPLTASLEEKEAALEDVISLKTSAPTKSAGFEETKDAVDLEPLPDIMAATEEEPEPPASVESFSGATELPVTYDEDDDEIFLLDENDILEEEEEGLSADDGAFAIDDQTPADDGCGENAPAQADGFFESLPESSFDAEPVTETEEFGLETGEDREVFSFSDENDKLSSFSETAESMPEFTGTEEREKPQSDMEFSFDDFEESANQEIGKSDASPEAPESPEISARVPSEEDNSVPDRPEPMYAQMEQKVHSLTDAQLHSIVEKVAGATIERMAREIIEQVAWEVVPNLSENIIKDEIEKIKIAQ